MDYAHITIRNCLFIKFTESSKAYTISSITYHSTPVPHFEL